MFPVKRFLAAVLLLCLFVPARAETLWDRYFDLECEAFYYIDYASDALGLEELQILDAIQASGPENWLLEIGFSIAKEYLEIAAFMQSEEDYSLDKAASNAHWERAAALAKDVTLEEIKSLSADSRYKGWCFYFLGLLAEDAQLKRDAFVLACSCFAESSPEEEMIALLQMMQVYFGMDGYLYRKVYGRDEYYQALYTDVAVLDACARVIECVDLLLREDMEAFTKIALYQCAMEARAFLAYAACEAGDVEGLRVQMNSSAAWLKRRVEFGDVSGSDFPENDVPVCRLYDAHIRALYAAQTGDDAALESAIADFEQARRDVFGEFGFPVEYIPLVSDEMEASIAELKKAVAS